LRRATSGKERFLDYDADALTLRHAFDGSKGGRTWSPAGPKIVCAANPLNVHTYKKAINIGIPSLHLTARSTRERRTSSLLTVTNNGSQPLTFTGLTFSDNFTGQPVLAVIEAQGTVYPAGAIPPKGTYSITVAQGTANITYGQPLTMTLSATARYRAAR
jgi:hypothetical protein